MNKILRHSFNQSDINTVEVPLVRLLHFLLGCLWHLINSPEWYPTLLRVVSPPAYLMRFVFLFSTTCLLFFTLYPVSPCVPEDVIRSVCGPRWEIAHVAAGMSMVTHLAQNSLDAKLLCRGDRVRGKGKMNNEEERKIDERRERRECEQEAAVWKDAFSQKRGVLGM